MYLFKLKKIAGFALLACGLLIAAPAFAKTIYVETWGNDVLDCGARSNPCQSIGTTIGFRAGPGDRIIVGPGRFTENFVILNNFAGQTLDGLRLESSHGRYATVIEAADDTLSVIRIFASNVRIGRRNKGFTITGATLGGRWGVEVMNPEVQRVHIESNRITGNDRGIEGSGDRVEIAYNLIDGNNVYGIQCSECTNSRIRNNEILDNGFSGIRITSSSDKVTVEKNLIERSGTRGVYLVASSRNLLVRNNAITLSGDEGILANNSDGYRIERNLVSYSGSWGLDIDQNTFLSNVQLRDNVTSANRNRIRDLSAGVLRGNTFAAARFGGSALELDGALTFGQFSGNATFGTQSGCGIENNSDSPLVYSRHYFGGNGVPDNANDNDGIDEACGAQMSSGTTTPRAPSLRTTTASRL